MSVPARARIASVLSIVAVAGAVAAAVQLHPETLTAWSAYVTATESRIDGEIRSRRGFLGVDFLADGDAVRDQLLRHAIVVRKAETADARGTPMAAPSALIHHVRGDVLIPGATISRVLDELQSAPPEQEDVLRSQVLERGPDRMRVFLRLQRTRLVTVTYDTEHLVTFKRLGERRAASVSVATRIVEIADPGTPKERALASGDDRGLLWRLNAYWRYEEVAGGVIAECESISLSRDAPPIVRYVVGPLVESTSREFMERTLRTLRQRFSTS